MQRQFDALLVIGHGTRDPTGLAEFQTLLDELSRRKPDWHVAGSFLELAEPSIELAVERLAQRGLTRIRAMPLVLFAGGHAKRDIPAAVARAAAGSPGVEIDLCPPLACHPEIVKLSAERHRQALASQNLAELNLAGQAPVAAAETLLVLVGRGGSDDEALADMHRLADLRRAAETAAGEPLGRVDVAFVAVAQPTLATVLRHASRSEFRRIIVQPHLLFAGNVLDEIRRLVDEHRLAEQRLEANARQQPGHQHLAEMGCHVDPPLHADGGRAAGGDGRKSGRQWLVTGVLGPDARLVTAVIDRVSRTPDPVGAARW